MTYITETGMTCILCPPGYFYLNDCQVHNTIALCKPCPKNTFSSTYNKAVFCAPCMAHCESEILVPVQKCNATADMVCDCPDGKILENPKSHAKCKPIKGCEPGSGLLQQATPEHGPVCAKCRPGITFSPDMSGEPCYLCTQCPHDDIFQKCNTTHDSICNVQTQTCPLKTVTSCTSSEIDWRPIFQFLSLQLTSDWENVIRSLFLDANISDWKAVIQQIQHDNDTVREQIYQCLLRWQQGGSLSKDTLIRILIEENHQDIAEKLSNSSVLENSPLERWEEDMV
ncbi:tumor necrosis factor receptor superfamily member 11B-like [Ylistrum balloti]|uniref:tumor necrosis factor receptor superfamily member 11B-like n=1 Tax=Ylistrum balloti TaxID=509963 RepID=UPI002905B6C5|nr:tumor necrosis factor receptor superfamily member 11B-like [Ylistrum balloti]